jgi:hypothetical protein
MSSRERSPGFITRDSETEYRAGRRIASRCSCFNEPSIMALSLPPALPVPRLAVTAVFRLDSNAAWINALEILRPIVLRDVLRLSFPSLV